MNKKRGSATFSALSVTRSFAEKFLMTNVFREEDITFSGQGKGGIKLVHIRRLYLHL